MAEVRRVPNRAMGAAAAAPPRAIDASSHSFRGSVGQGSGGRLLSSSLRIGWVSSPNGSLHPSDA